MIGMQTKLDVADNSGARRLRCILPRGGSVGSKAGLGDIVMASVQEAAPDSNLAQLFTPSRAATRNSPPLVGGGGGGDSIDSYPP